METISIQIPDVILESYDNNLEEERKIIDSFEEVEQTLREQSFFIPYY